ncbi:MAG: hypothetical protein R3E66_20095 [bacterium]
MEMKFVCDLKWDDLQGGGTRRRDCESCGKPVYNLSGMTRSQAAKLLAEHGDKPPCVRFVSKNGEIVHNGDPYEQLARQRRGTKILIGSALALHLGIAAMSQDPLVAVLNPFNVLSVGEGHHEVMGEMAPAEPVVWFPDEIPTFASDTERIEFARMNFRLADEARNADAPTSRYDEFRALSRARVATAPLAELPPELTRIAVRVDELERAIKLDHQSFEVAVRHAYRAQQYETMRATIDAYRASFSDTKSIWSESAEGWDRRLSEVEPD